VRLLDNLDIFALGSSRKSRDSALSGSAGGVDASGASLRRRASSSVSFSRR
jgi:hypothetical protein